MLPWHKLRRLGQWVQSQEDLPQPAPGPVVPEAPTSVSNGLKVLIIEDNPADARLIVQELRTAGFEPEATCVQDESGFCEQLNPDLDVILSDYKLSQFDGLRALSLLKLSGYDIPFILVSGTIDQDTGIASLRSGANDFLMKDRLARLGPAVQRALQERMLRRQKQQAEAEWHKTAARYLELFNNTPVGICLTSRDAKFLAANPAIVRMLGYESEQELVQTITDLSRQLYATPSQYLAFQQLIELQGALNAFESEFLCKDGSKLWVSQSGRAIRNGQGETTGYEIFLEDITHRKNTEIQLHKLSRAVEQSPVSVVITDMEGRIEYINPKCEQVSGYTSLELIGQKPSLLKGGETKPEVYKELWIAISSGREWSGDLHNRKKSGELFWEHVAISPIRNQHGQITHFLAIKEDITEHKQLEERILRAQRLENIGRLAGGIAHDLNNVLSPILMSLQVLRERFEDPATEPILKVIQNSAKRGADIVRQVLAFGRGMESRKIELQPNNLIRELSGLIHQTFPKQITTNINCDRSLPTILGDPTQIHQVLLNLCVNARDAMPEGGDLKISSKPITVDAPMAESLPGLKPGLHVLIEVKDTGTGIPPEIRAKIFDPFFTTKEVGKGTGLGLSTSFGIIQNHQGFIDVVSAPGEGACFRVYLPALEQTAPTGRIVEETPIPQGNGELILVVEDDVSIRMITAETLTYYGYCCLAVADGQEAISTYLENKEEIALVLTDLMMPGMDGAALIQVLQHLNPSLKIIAMSGNLLEETTRQPRIPSEHFLTKPFSAKALLMLLHKVIHSPAENG